MDIKKAFSDFYDELNAILSEHGFAVSKAEESAVKKIDIGFYEIYFSTHKLHDYAYKIDLKIWLRCDLIQKIRGNVTPKYAKPNSLTILSAPYLLLRIFGKPELDFEKNSGNVVNFDNKNSKDKWLMEFKKFMLNVGFPFFENFKNVEDFDQWFNKPISEDKYGYDTIVNWNNYVCGLIAAKLVKNADYDKIYSARMKDLLRVENEDGIKELESIKLYLDEHYK